MAQVLSDCADARARLELDAGVEVPERVHPVRGGSARRRPRAQRRLPDVRVEVVPAQPSPFAGREHEAIDGRMDPQMLGELHGHDIRQRHLADTSTFRRRHDQVTAHDLHLLPDVDLPAEEVDVCDPKAEHLTLTEPAARGDDRDRPPPLRVRVDHHADLLGRPRHDPRLLDRRSPHRPRRARITDDQAVLDRSAKNRGQVREQHPHVARRTPLLPGPQPPLNRRRLDCPELEVLERR